MARKNLIRLREYPYHVTTRSNNKEWFDLPMQDVWRICMESLYWANAKHPVIVQAFVLMSNHYHLLLYTPNSDLDKFMNVFNSLISKKIRNKTQRINRIFGDRYKWTIVNNKSYYENVIRYIFQNPMRAGLVVDCENYPYSSLYYQKNGLKFPVRLPKRFESQEFFSYANSGITEDIFCKVKTGISKLGYFDKKVS